MSKTLKDAFTAGKAFIPFITCGDPDLAMTEALIVALAEGGADAIELGIPFSDPTAEGPVIQDATGRALKAGTTTEGVFAMVEAVRKKTDVPLLFMTYANVVFSYGIERFTARCEALGVSGLVLPDVPFEECAEFEGACDAHGIALIRFVAPTSGERIPMICRGSKGFIYVVSSLGVTGVREGVPAELTDTLASIRAATDTPACVGFGIATPEQARVVAQAADGAIVGSAVVKLAHEKGAGAPAALKAYAQAMKAAMNG